MGRYGILRTGILVVLMLSLFTVYNRAGSYDSSSGSSDDSISRDTSGKDSINRTNLRQDLIIQETIFSKLPSNNEHTAKDRIRITRELIQEKDLKERRIDESDLRKGKELLLRMKKQYMDSLSKSEKLRIKVSQNKIKLRECKKLDEIRCNILRNESFQDGKDYLIEVINSLIDHLTGLKSKIEISEEINESESDERILRINEIISEFEELRQEISLVETKEELMSYRERVHKLLTTAKSQTKLTLEIIRARRLGEIIQRIEHLEAKLFRIQDRFSDAIRNNSEVRGLIVNFTESVDGARYKYNLAIEKLEASRNSNDSENRHSLAAEGHRLLKEAHNDLKDAHEIIKRIYFLLKSIDKKIVFNNDECWQDRPLFIPGKDLGYFIWQSSCNDKTIVVAWSGDGKLNMTYKSSNSSQHRMNGKISSNGNLMDISVRKFEKNDLLSLVTSEITFDAHVSKSYDFVSFKTNGTKLNLDLEIDGIKIKEKIFIGKAVNNPLSVPFDLEVEPALVFKCQEEKFIVNEKCKSILDVTDREED